MNFIFTTTTTVLLTLSVLKGQDPRAIPPLRELESDAYAVYVLNDAYSKAVSKSHPKLIPRITRALTRFNASALGKSRNTLEMSLAAAYADKWPAYKKIISEEIDKGIANGITEKVAENFTLMLEDRSKGRMPYHTRSTLLSYNPDFFRNPKLEFDQGWKQTLRTKNHKKNSGLDISISFPLSWMMSESKAPATLRQFQSKTRNGLVHTSLDIYEIPLNINEENFFTEKSMKISILPGSTFISSQKATFNGLHGAHRIYDVTKKSNGNHSRITETIISYQKRLISITTYVYSLDNKKESVIEMHNRVLPLLKAIPHSLVIHQEKKK